jgi:hypothetical protein
MEQAEWLEKYFERIAQSCDEGHEAVDFVRARRARVGIKKARKSVGAFFTLTKRIYLNAHYHTYESSLENPHAWTLFIHEACHLKQGVVVAMSIYGELEAWQTEFRVFQKISGKPLKPILNELLAMPLGMNRANLRRAREIMMEHAGKGYGANWLPLYPIHKEIKYWVTRKESQPDNPFQNQ